jgi:hypothetical protein
MTIGSMKKMITAAFTSLASKQGPSVLDSVMADQFGT